MPAPRARRHLSSAVVLATVAALCAGCITRPVRDTVVDEDGLEIILRGQKRGFTVVPAGFDHPATIAPVRMAHILSRIDMRKGGGADAERKPVVPLETLYDIADGVSKGLAKATPDQEVVVQSIRRTKRFGVFDRHYLTSLLCYMRDDVLYIHVSRSDWEIPERKETRLPETHAGQHPLDFRLVIDRGMALVDEQAVAVQWRDDVFKRPTRTRVTGAGKVVRREVLLESFEDPTEFDDVPVVSEDLSPEQLRALADLEERRRAGHVTEAEYGSRRRAILRGDTAP